MTPQEIFNEVATKILAQGTRCGFVNEYGTDNGGYAYQNTKGQRCAVGWLMNDEEIEAYKNYANTIDMLLEEQSISDKGRDEDVPPMFPLRPLFSENLELLQDLQKAHDFQGSDTWLEKWKEKMRNVATKHNLDPSILN